MRSKTRNILFTGNVKRTDNGVLLVQIETSLYSFEKKFNISKVILINVHIIKPLFTFYQAPIG